MHRANNVLGILLAALLIIAVGGCGGGSNSLTADLAGSAPNLAALSPDEATPEAMADLLSGELERLGKDASATRSDAPSELSDVFDLEGVALDPDDDGPEPPNGVRLQWTERLLGDYDNNGEVSITDLSPLSQYLMDHVEYRDPLAAKGLSYWPAGDPDDLGGAQPGQMPAADTGGYNWRLARVDGDSNGEINLGDITVIAQHFGEFLTGYRVYRKGPGEDNYMLLQHLSDPSSPATINREDMAAVAPNGGLDHTRVVRYSFDDYFSLDGVYEYRVVPYAESIDAEGAAIATIWIDSLTGEKIDGGLKAILSATPDDGIIPLAVNLDGFYSNGEIVRFEWDFDGDGAYDRNTGQTSTTTHNYVQNATYNATLRVTDRYGNTDTTSVQIAVRSPEGNKAPEPALTALPTQGVYPLSVDFDASGSLDTDGAIVKHEWDFDGDGNFDLNTGTIATATHVYYQNASYMAAVRLTDDQGGTATTSIPITVQSPAGNQPPLAAISAELTEGVVPFLASFDGSGSTDIDGQILSHEWDFDGDGLYDLNTGTNAQATHLYTQNASYTVRLRVTDDDGGTATASVNIIALSPDGNQPPLASLTANPSQGVQPLHVQFDGGGSIDLDGEIVKHEWDFDGDGTFDLNTGTQALATHVYDDNQTFNAVLRVTDNDGGTASANIAIVVKSPDGNIPPVAAVSANPATGILPLNVSFDGSGSYDDDGMIVKHEWDFDGNGLFDLDTGTVASASFLYENNANYNARLRVTDNDGAVSLATILITVKSPNGNAAPLAAVTADPTAGDPPLAVDFDGSGSTDVDGQIVTHEWDFDGDGNFDLNTGTVPYTSHTYVTTDFFQAKLRVTDDQGAFAEATVGISTEQSVSGNKPPTVSLAANPTSGQVDYEQDPDDGSYINDGLAVLLTATAQDTDGTVEKYEWDYEGDGIFDTTTGNQNTLQHIYKDAGSYAPRVRVVDDLGATTVSDPASVTVNNRKPFMDFTYSPQPATGKTAVETPVTITLSATGCVDIDGEIVKYEWDLDDDGTYEVDSGFETTYEVDFPIGVSETNTYGLRVTDNSGATKTATVDVSLKDEYDEVENDDYVNQATPFYLQTDNSMLNNEDPAQTITDNKLHGNLSGVAPDGYDSDDADWYALYLPGPRSVDIALSGYTPAEIDLNLRVYAANGTTLLASSLKEDALDSIDDLVFLCEGWFFVKVNRFSGTNLDSADYDLTVTPSAITLSEAEDNDTRATAQSIASTRFAPNGHLLDYYGEFTTSGNNDDDSDWFTWSVPGGIDFFVNLYFCHSNADLDVYLVDQTGAIVASSTSVTDNEFIQLDQLTAGDWFLRVARSGGGACTYQLDVLGGGSVTLWEITGDTLEEVPIGGGAYDKDVTFTDQGNGDVYQTNSGSGAHWTLNVPNGTYTFDVEDASFLVDPATQDVIENMPVTIQVLNGDAIYWGTNATFNGDVLTQPIWTGEHY